MANSPNFNPDMVENLSAVEDRGVYRSLVRKARLIYKSADITSWRTNATLLTKALEYLDGYAGFKAMDRLGNIRNFDDRFALLTLVRRTPAISQNDPCCVDVVLNYEHIVDGPNQVLLRPSNGLIFGKGRTSIVEKSTNFFYPYGIRIKTNPTDPNDTRDNKTAIVVAHTYPTWETGIAASPHNPTYPRTIIQGGEINIPYPQSTYNVQGIFATARPAKLAHFAVASINAKEWQGMPALTWICSEVQWEVNDPSDKVGGIGKSPTYRMQFEFQYNVDTWDPAVVFIDQRTSRPPADVRQAEFEATTGPAGVLRMVQHPTNGKEIPAGVWKVPALRRLDIDAFFGALFEGAAPPAFN